MSTYTASDIKALREFSGVSLDTCKRALEMAQSEKFGGDVIWALAALDADALAVSVKGDRDAWNARHGAETAKRWRERCPELNEKFPIQDQVQ